MKIAVTGATGQLGNLVIKELKKRVSGENLVALARSPEKASGFGIETRAFDYTNSEQLTDPLRDIDRLLLISSSEIGQRAVQHTNVINAAKKAGVQWIVYTSLLHAETSSLNLAAEHLASEKVLKESDIEYTILRNGWYTENYTGSVESALKSGILLGCAGEGKISSATRADFAAAAAVAITDERHKGKVYELAGDEAYTLKDLAAEISKQSGKAITYNDVPEEKYAEILKSVGLPDFFAEAIASWDISASKGDLFDDSHQLSKLIGRPTTPLSDAVKEVLK